MLNCRSHSTVRDGRKATTQTSSSHLIASRTCVRSRSWTLSHPPTQHRPICVSVKPVVVPQPTPFWRRFNLRKADWNGYSTELDNHIEDVEPIPSNYNRFVENVRVASRRHIPRGCRTDYVQGLTDESKNLYDAYKQQYSSNPFDNRTMESGNLLLDKMTEEKRKIWEEVITWTNMTHNSRKAWKTINV